MMNAIKFSVAATAVAGLLAFGAMTIAAEPHPEINKAERQLRAAKADLEHASKDFEGLRVAAIKLIDQALHELQEAKKVDKN